MPRRRSPKPQTKGGTPLVRTTITLPETLWQEAKIRAVEERKDLRDLIIEGLQMLLARKKGGK